jgi:hypothetical protein
MKLPHRRHFLHLAAGAAALSAVSRFAGAQAYPTRPVKIVVPAGPSGSYDIVGRALGGPTGKTACACTLWRNKQLYTTLWPASTHAAVRISAIVRFRNAIADREGSNDTRAGPVSQAFRTNRAFA